MVRVHIATVSISLLVVVYLSITDTCLPYVLIKLVSTLKMLRCHTDFCRIPFLLFIQNFKLTLNQCHVENQLCCRVIDSKRTKRNGKLSNNTIISVLQWPAQLILLPWIVNTVWPKGCTYIKLLNTHIHSYIHARTHAISNINYYYHCYYYHYYYY